MRNLPLYTHNLLNVRLELQSDLHFARTRPDSIDGFIANMSTHERWLIDIVDRMAAPRKKNASFINAYKRRKRNK